MSDNPAYDWQWIAGLFDRAGMDNPFGHSARRISDFWAGLNRDWSDTQGWKRWRRTAHDHNPVNCSASTAATSPPYLLRRLSHQPDHQRDVGESFPGHRLRSRTRDYGRRA